MKERALQLTSDGSHTIMHHQLNQTYHSRHGALQESLHVFIEAGLRPAMQSNQSLSIFEFGFGTGLNAWLTAIESASNNFPIYYETIEAFPVEEALWRMLNFGTLKYNHADAGLLTKLHEAPWETFTEIHPFFQIKKLHCSFVEYQPSSLFDLIYFDAFSPNAQPELWTVAVFEKLYGMMNEGGLLTTYCSKSYVRRNMQAAGFVVKKLAGPPGKREMLTAGKTG